MNLTGRSILFSMFPICTACRFSQPCIRCHHTTSQRTDAIEKTVTNVDSWQCFHFVWNRDPHLIGSFDASRTYNDDGKLLAEARTRRAIHSSTHKHQKEFRKRVWHPTGKVTMIDQSVDKYHDPMQIRTLHKTWIWDAAAGN